MTDHGTYVIERCSENLREWGTGTEWSEDDRAAKWYEHEPDAPRETDDEQARTVHYPSGEVEAG